MVTPEDRVIHVEDTSPGKVEDLVWSLLWSADLFLKFFPALG